MSIPAISFYANPSSNLCSTPHQSCSISPSSYCDLNRPSLSFTCGLSLPFSSPSVRHSSPDDAVVSCSYSCGPPSKHREHRHSPVSVFQGPASCGGSCARGPPPPHRILVGELRWGRDMLFSGFVGNALGSYVEFDAQSKKLDPEEFGFYMEGFEEMEEGCEFNAMDMLSEMQSRHNIFKDEFVVKAFVEAGKAHRGQARVNGEPYLKKHCSATAVLLADVGANATVVAAGLLHDTLDDSFMSYNRIFRLFGAGVAELVQGVSKLSQLSKLARDNNIVSKHVETDRLRTMFLAMADARAILIKLADRLDNMMTLSALPLSKQHCFAKETLEIFVPLANRLRVFIWKDKLENLCFKCLHPEQYKDLSSKLAKLFDEAMVANAKGKLEDALHVEGVAYHVLYERHKSLFSIYSKMLKKNTGIDKIHDIIGLRLIVESEDDCYRALDIVRKLWKQVPGRQKDYIAHPQLNGYQSLHTVVQSDDGYPLEVQIRTREMHKNAEFGFAAHWIYKEGPCQHSSYVLQVVEWARWVLKWQCETIYKDCHLSFSNEIVIKPPCTFPLHAEECPYNYKPQCDEDGPIFVILLEHEMMSVQEFPANTTLSDLLEMVGSGTTQWTTHGFLLKEVLRPRVNKETASDLHRKLKMGDVIELTPAIPDEALTGYREEIQRMFEHGMAVAGSDYS